jgi:hypothetical protein
MPALIVAAVEDIDLTGRRSQEVTSSKRCRQSSRLQYLLPARGDPTSGRLAQPAATGVVNPNLVDVAFIALVVSAKSSSKVDHQL